jgi:micrococcal nuclease
MASALLLPSRAREDARLAAIAASSQPRLPPCRFPEVAVRARSRRLLTPVAPLVAAGLALVSTVGCTFDGTAADRAGQATVVAVVDGDTIEVRIAGRTETVRLLGVDTPETKHPTEPVGCFGPEAAAHTKELLPEGTEVRLERDSEPRDTFGRLLAYVRRTSDGLFVNVELVAQGYAHVLLIEPNHAYRSELRAAEAAARTSGRGLWRAC